jgi:hypothetical protein
LKGGVRTGNCSKTWDPDPTQGATLPAPAVAKVPINARSPPDALSVNLVNVANVLTHSAEALGVFIQQAYNLHRHRSADLDGRMEICASGGARRKREDQVFDSDL